MYFVLLLCSTCLNTQFTSVHGILGGNEISISEAPYQVNYGDICGGVLIHREWALTTAHCGTEETFIRVGSKYRRKSRKVNIITHIVHPRFSKLHEFDFDVQLLKFRRLRFSKNVYPIEISDGECGNVVYVTGWGFSGEKGQYNKILRRAKLLIVPKTECQTVPQPWYNNTLTSRMFCAEGDEEDACQGQYNKILRRAKLLIVPKMECQTVPQPWYNNTLTSRMFCAEGDEEDACQGDSGGPAVSFGRLVGVSSFGYGCGRVPGVYVNVSDENIKKWMKKHII